MIRFTRFCLVGCSGVLIDMAVLFFLSDPRMGAIPLLVAKLVAAEIAIVNNFIWNDIWTFREYTIKHSFANDRIWRFLKFNGICSSGLIISVLLLYFQVVYLSLNPYIANALAIMLTTVWNFTVSLRYSWRSGEKILP
jgi:dolichol-phosphate mannosyltransferase